MAKTLCADPMKLMQIVGSSTERSNVAKQTIPSNIQDVFNIKYSPILQECSCSLEQEEQQLLDRGPGHHHEVAEGQ